MSRVPDLFIVGAPKAGTTSLYDSLKDHPQVFMSPVKEPSYFSRDLDLDPSSSFFHYGTDEQRYMALFDDAVDERRVGEGSTRYLFSQDAPKLIKNASPDARIVAMVRNPVDMVRSLHAHKVAAGTEDLIDLREALAAEGDRHAGRRIPPLSNPKLSTYRDRALFSEQLVRWIDEFDRDRVHVMVFEDVISNTPAELKRLLEFLEVDASYTPESFAARNKAHAARSRLLRRAASTRPAQIAVWRVLPKVIGDTRTNELVRRFRESRLHRKPMKHEPIPADLRRDLEDYFAADVARLSEMLGRDLSELWFKRPSNGEARS